MSINLNETLAIFSVPIRKPNLGDWLAAIERAEGGFRLIYRFRWYHNDDPYADAWEEKDEKNWYEIATIKEPLAALLGVLRAAAARISAEGGGGEIVEILRGEMSDADFAAQIAAHPMFHTKFVGEAPGRH